MIQALNNIYNFIFIGSTTFLIYFLLRFLFIFYRGLKDNTESGLKEFLMNKNEILSKNNLVILWITFTIFIHYIF